MQPLITIVTVCFNSEATIKKTIESVIGQDLTEAEYLIVDGASTDNTINVINRYKSILGDKLRIISEKDRGWYDAMNKGVLNAHGKFIVFINSDDYFDEGAIAAVAEFIKSRQIAEDCIVYGDSTNIYKNSKGKTLYRRIVSPEKLTIADKHINAGMCGIRHQSMFTGTAVFQKVGLLDLQYRLHADWDFLIKCLKADVKMYRIDKNLTFYSMYGASTRPNYKERHELRKKNKLYRSIDVEYIKDRWGLKVIAKRILGERRWNDVLFRLHSIKQKPV